MSRKWLEGIDTSGLPAIRVRFAHKNCVPCPVREVCTKAKGEPHEMTLRPQAEHAVLQENRVAPKTGKWQQRYRRRAGIEGMLSQGVRGWAMRRSRYICQQKTHLQLVATAAGVNWLRIKDGLAQVPRAAPVRVSARGWAGVWPVCS